MQDLFQELQWALALGLFPYLVPVIMPSWRWLAGCVLLAGGALALLWAQHFIAVRSPGYNAGPGGALGIAMFSVVTLAFTVGVATRVVTLALAASGWSFRTTFGLRVAGIPLFLALLLAPTASDKWRLRPPSAACSESVFNVELAQSRLAIPAAPFFQVYLGPNSGTDAYYLWSVESLRAFCSRTANGQRPVRATNLGLNFQHVWQRQRATGANVPDWARAYCDARRTTDVRRIDDIDFPLTAQVFSPKEFRLGDFLGVPSTYDLSLKGPRPFNEERFIQSGAKTPDGNPLTFACRKQSDGSSWCTASYGWNAGAHLHYAFRAPPDRIEERGRRIDASMQAFLAPLRAR